MQFFNNLYVFRNSKNGFYNRVFFLKSRFYFKYQKPIILKIEDSSFVELVKKRVWCFYLKFAVKLDF